MIIGVHITSTPTKTLQKISTTTLRGNFRSIFVFGI